MIYFIQPVLAKYRASFFSKISEAHCIEVHFSKVDFLGVKTFNDSTAAYKKKQIGNFLSFNKKLYWQRGVSLFSYKKNDIVVICGNPRLINHMILLIVCKIRGVPVIWWGQGWTAGSNGLFSKLRLKIMTIADGVAVYTEEESKKLNHINKIVGLNNGLDIKSIRSISDKKKSNPDTNILNMLFIGRLTEKSDINLLFDALILVNRDFHLHVIGDGDLTSFIHEFISENKLGTKVTLHGAIYEEYEIAKIADICDCFVYPGSVGLSLIHAFAYGLPAIIHNSYDQHMPEYSAFKNEYNGISFIYKNKYSLANTIDSIDAKSLRVMKENSYNTVTKTYNTDDMAERFSRLVELL